MSEASTEYSIPSSGFVALGQLSLATGLVLNLSIDSPLLLFAHFEYSFIRPLKSSPLLFLFLVVRMVVRMTRLGLESESSVDLLSRRAVVNPKNLMRVDILNIGNLLHEGDNAPSAYHFESTDIHVPVLSASEITASFALQWNGLPRAAITIW